MARNHLLQRTFRLYGKIPVELNVFPGLFISSRHLRYCLHRKLHAQKLFFYFLCGSVSWELSDYYFQRSVLGALSIRVIHMKDA